MQNHLKIGSNFDYQLIDKIKEINDKHTDAIIDEVYGSRRESAKYTARPAFRLPDIDRKTLCEYTRQLKSIGVLFNYTLNSNYLGSKEDIQKNETEILEYIKFLSDAGGDIITVTLPLMAEYIRSVDNKIGIEISTIAHIDTVTQVAIWKERYGIRKICGNLYKNREVKFLRKLATYCNNNGIVLSIMVNEFCGNGLIEKSGATNCIFRDHCYGLHSIGYDKDNRICSDYPMDRCIQSRARDIDWLKMNFIRPEDLKLYNTIGINHFKITGRTGSTNYIIKVAEAYADGRFDGNILELWKHLETINGEKDDSKYTPNCYINNRNLEGFLKFWFENELHICANEECGVSCTYCDNFYNNNVIEKD